jgi:Fibronectin type III-like domain/Glycosyl hydrolase family 3 N terminal domain
MVLSRMTLANEITMVEGQGIQQPYVLCMAAQPALCIPAMGLEDGPVGVGDGLTGVTQLPAAVSLAATFDPSLAQAYGKVIGQEEWGKGAAVNLGPTINIDRDPRWGRSFEAYTEDPFLSGTLAVNEIGGVQSTREMSQVKHFAAYNQETNRNTPQDDVLASTRTLAGSDVAQLYRGDPPVAGEPPRQLKGFQRVTLNPGQSTKVTFNLNRQDLAYWNTSTNNWVVPEGRFQVHVGDSSALANLPLHGSFIRIKS